MTQKDNESGGAGQVDQLLVCHTGLDSQYHVEQVLYTTVNVYRIEQKLLSAKLKY
jgi:hypothetical protein